jgi:TonB family protein
MGIVGREAASVWPGGHGWELTGGQMLNTISKMNPMKPTMILLFVAWQAAFGQSQQGPRTAARQRLRVGLRVDSPEQQIRDVLARELRKLQDVEVVPLPTGRDQQGLNDADDVELRVLVSENHGVEESLRRSAPGRRYSITVTVGRPDKNQQTASPDGTTGAEPQSAFITLEDSQSGRVAAAWIAVADEKDLESTCADLVSRFNHEVVDADPKEPASVEPPPEPIIVLPLVFLPPDSGLSPIYDVPPTVIRKVPPEYSEVARRAGVEGVVVLYAEVDTSGQALNVRVIRSLGYGLDERAIEAVTKWRFRPALKDGKPVQVGSTFEVFFMLLRQ